MLCINYIKLTGDYKIGRIEEPLEKQKVIKVTNLMYHKSTGYYALSHTEVINSSLIICKIILNKKSRFNFSLSEEERIKIINAVKSPIAEETCTNRSNFGMADLAECREEVTFTNKKRKKTTNEKENCPIKQRKLENATHIQIENKKPPISCDLAMGIDNPKQNPSSDSEMYVKETLSTELGQRIYNKYHCCLFCSNFVIKMARHLETQHGNELEVAKILALPVNSTSRRNEFLRIIRVGDFNHNLEVLAAKKGQLILARRPNENENFKDVSKFGPCPNCLGFFQKTLLWRHKKKCESKKNGDAEIRPKMSIQGESNVIINSIILSEVQQDFRVNIIDSFSNDDVSFVCKFDSLIVKFGSVMYEKYGNTQKEMIRQSMRQLGRLLIEIRNQNNEESTRCLKYFILPKYFDVIVNAVKKLARMEQNQNERSEFGVPSLALKIGYSLKKCGGVLRGEALRNSDDGYDKSLRNLLYLLELEWSNRISSNALATMQTRKINHTTLLPLTSDLKKLNSFIDKEIITNKNIVMEQSSKEAWLSLAQLTLTRIILFNKRRSGEVSRMRIKHYRDIDWTTENTEELQQSLTELEIKLANSLKLVQIPGKRGRIVAVLLTPQMTFY